MVKTINKKSSLYPPLLGQIKDPPEVLYYSGDIALASKPCVAVVGARKATEYGKWAAGKIGRRLSRNGITVVSGMASGIDTAAHKAALQGEGSTIAVLGCGLDICFPRENKGLKEDIAAFGLLLSEYPLGYPNRSYTFPRRNRIISGLAVATVIVEAASQSGSLITAELAAEQGREVYAVPGNITSPMSLGTNKLIRDGANILSVIDDLIGDLGFSPVPDEKILKNLSRQERILVEHINRNGEVTIDFLCGCCQISPAEMSGIITVLEIKGIVHCSFGKIFIAK